MSPERVLSTPLSGEEVRTAILDTLSRRLEKDGYLNPNLAYDSFKATITIHVECHDVGRVAAVDVTETVTPVDNENAALEQADSEFEIKEAPPNEVRVETGQPVPVLTKDTDGRSEIKGVRYARNRAKKVG